MGTKLEVQKYLRSNSLLQLEQEYKIIYKTHSVYSNLILFRYNQLESPFNERIVQECRGLILDSSKNWAVVCYPFNKWFNFGEPNAATIDWSTAKVQEKLDGSLLDLWYYDGNWQVSTSGCPDGLNLINDTGMTFKDLFWETFKKEQYGVNGLNLNTTYMFELTSPFNRVVVDHKESHLTLIGVRNNKTLEEFPTSVVSLGPDNVLTFMEVLPRVPKQYPLGSIEDCIEAAKHLNPLENEGYVVVDKYFNRIKIKSPNYIILHHLRDSMSLKRMAEVIRTGEHEELKIALDSYPELKVRFDELVGKYKSIVTGCWEHYIAIAGIKDQKEFAEKALQSPYSSVLFAMRKTNKTPVEIIKGLTGNAYLRLMEVK